MPPSLSLQGGRRPTWRPEREARGSALGVQSRESSCVFADGFPVIRPGTARLPRRFAPRNDTSGGAVVHQCPPAAEFSCTRRSLSAATDAIGWYILSTACTVRRCSAGRGMPGPYHGVSEIKGARKIKGSSELINKSGWREIFLASRGMENAGILCVFQVFHTDGLPKKIRHPPQMIDSEFPPSKGGKTCFEKSRASRRRRRSCAAGCRARSARAFRPSRPARRSSTAPCGSRFPCWMRPSASLCG